MLVVGAASAALVAPGASGLPSGAAGVAWVELGCSADPPGTPLVFALDGRTFTHLTWVFTVDAGAGRTACAPGAGLFLFPSATYAGPWNPRAGGCLPSVGNPSLGMCLEAPRPGAAAHAHYAFRLLQFASELRGTADLVVADV